LTYHYIFNVELNPGYGGTSNSNSSTYDTIHATDN
jgi:hypothetical protein